MELRTQRVDLVEIIEQALEESRGALDDRRHRLTVELSERPLTVMGDPVRLSQVFVNLLSNAIKFTPHGGHIDVCVRTDGSEAVLQFKDSGIGIPPHMLKHVFEMFGQVGTAGEAGRDGLGIGLTLAQQLVALHGGRIEVRSAGEGCGSEFTVRLPLQADSAARVE